MEKVAGAVVLVNSFLLCNAILNLTGTDEIEGVSQSSTILPCTYVPSHGFNQTTVVWTMERNDTRDTIIQRNLTGDHTPLTQYRDRVSIQKEILGNVSLQIKNLEIPDSGRYTCEVTWTAHNDSLTTKNVTTKLRVVEAILDLTGTDEIEGVWKSSTILPCIYVPSDHFNQTTVVWTMERDQTRVTVIQRDLTGDHTLLTRYRDRVSIEKEIPGNVSLQIKNLEIPDSGLYTCKVTWTAQDDSRTTKEMTTTLRVVKGPEEPQTTSARMGTVAQSTATSYLDKSEGLKESTTTKRRPDPMVSGTTIATSQKAAGLKESTTTTRRPVPMVPRTTIATFQKAGDLKEPTTRSPKIETMAYSTIIPDLEEYEGDRRIGLPLYLIILIPVLCVAMVIFVIITIIFCRNKNRSSL
ncbi:V-set and immunoglobulin domain-containing protein 4-like isoform X2 [Alligator sinensis]|uniref:V-set and immunoglobulin domain-containing protein 4-like isoform X2 n=1 Tax=Alligator sinensis TaxID=38654 RepID=UPI0006EADF1A|nr:V-set and immunoglobulin domain-containing protein 4-like isoform X2 [Alligator sinensis]